MSWLFGYKTPQPQMASAGGSDDGQPNTAGQASGDQKLTSAERKAMEAYRFDSSALERAAEAAKTLERSSNFIFLSKLFFLNENILLHNKIV